MTTGFDSAKQKVNQIITLLEEIEEEKMGLAEASAFSDIMGNVSLLRKELEEKLDVLEAQPQPIVSWVPRHVMWGKNG